MLPKNDLWLLSLASFLSFLQEEEFVFDETDSVDSQGILSLSVGQTLA